MEGYRVPGFDLAVIRTRATGMRDDRPDGKTRMRSWLFGLGVIVLPCAAAAALVFPSPAMRALVLRMTNASHLPATTVVYNMALKEDPRNALRDAAFTLRLPSGLPAGSKMVNFFKNGTSGTSYGAEYQLSGGEHVVFSLDKAQPKARYLAWRISIPTDAAGNPKGEPQKVPARVWIAGNEVVTVDANSMPATQLTAIERAMHGHDAPIMHPPGK